MKKSKKKLKKDDNMRYLVRKIVYANAEDYTTDDDEKQELLEWVDNNIWS